MRRLKLLLQMGLLFIAVLFSSPAFAQTSTNTIHLTQDALSVRGPDKQTAHDNAYAQADNAMRLACAAAPLGTGGTSRLENEQEDSTSYEKFGSRVGWMANIMLEADCAVTNNN